MFLGMEPPPLDERQSASFLAVGIFAMAYAKNLDRIAAVVEADAVIAEPEAKLRRLDSLQAFHVSLFVGDEAGQVM